MLQRTIFASRIDVYMQTQRSLPCYLNSIAASNYVFVSKRNVRLGGEDEGLSPLHSHGFAHNNQVKVNRVTRVLGRALDYSKRIKFAYLAYFLNFSRQRDKASTVC